MKLLQQVLTVSEDVLAVASGERRLHQVCWQSPKTYWQSQRVKPRLQQV